MKLPIRLSQRNLKTFTPSPFWAGLLLVSALGLALAACDLSGRLSYPTDRQHSFSGPQASQTATVQLDLPAPPTPGPDAAAPDSGTPASPTSGAAAPDRTASAIALTPSATPPALTDLVLSIPAPSLAGNLLGDPDQVTIQVLLPPSYATSDKRYPVVYFLPGYGGAVGGAPDYYPQEQVAELMANGTLKEMILVTANGANALGGGFYVNSPVTGNWEDFVVTDLLGYVDQNYRTITAPSGRAIAGHSMGGFGAFNLAMRHPDLFSAAYLLAPGLLGEQGLADFHVLNPEKRVRNFLGIYQELIAMDDVSALKKMKTYDGPLALSLAYGTAFAPNPELGAPFFDYPYRLDGDKLVKNPDTWKKWEDGMGNLAQKVAQNRDALLQLGGIAIDYAEQDRLDWIPRGSRYLAGLLSEAGIPNQLTSYAGDHADRIPERLVEIMLPFFNNLLAAPEE